MSGTPVPASSRPSAAAATTPKGGADKLVLQDPQAFDQGTQPQLRPSLEARPESGSGDEREKWRGLWEQFDSDPQVIAERLQERKKLLQSSELQRREAEALKKRSSDLEAALQTAQEERFNHPLVYGGAAGLIGMAGLWLLERRRRIASEEKALQADAQAELLRQEEESRSDSVLDLYEADTAGWAEPAHDVGSDRESLRNPSSTDPSGASQPGGAPFLPNAADRVITVKDPVPELDSTKPAILEVLNHAPAASAEPRSTAFAAATEHPTSADPAMDHLLELRTMVGGLLALGRPQEAALLLKTHIELEPQTCAWAYLECMQLHEKLNQATEFDELREAYRAQFNRMPPSWQEPNAHVLGLDGYSRASAELCNAWRQGADSARQVISSWLMGPLVGRKYVQLPAFHDLLDLYEMLEWMSATSDAPIGASAPSTWAAALVNAAQSNESSDAPDFLPTVSLLDLDYEFPSDLTLQKDQAEMAEKTVTVVKPGEFSLDFNLEGGATQGLFSQPAALSEK
jgi:hypothetical protein